MTVRARWWAAGAVVVLVVAAAVGAGVFWVRRADSAAVAPTTVVLQAAGDEGTDPFMAAPAGRPSAVSRPHLPDTGSAAAVTATVDPDTGARSVSGTTDRLYSAGVPGNQELYGGSGSLSACDPAAIAEFLAAHPDKAAAWAQVRGISPDEIAGYLDSLTPVLLLHDTLVTNHGFADGVATPLVSVLQAGTGVLVDSTGLPVVRCACGNPLTAAPTMNLSTATIQGSPWDGYDPNRTVVVTAGPTVTQFLVVDADSGQDITLSTGPPATAPPVSSTADTPTAPATTEPATTTSDEGACVLDLTWPEVTRGWIEPLDPTFTCQEMIDQWRRNEQWPGERGGTMAVVDWADGWYCTGVHWDPNRPPTNAVGDCDLGGRRFNVYKGEPGQRSPAGDATPTPSGAPAGTTTAPASGVADLLITPSQNIICARHGDQFGCSIKQFDFDFDLAAESCHGPRWPFVQLDATGTYRVSSCPGDFFVTPSWPDPTPYGSTVTLGEISCDVQESGLTCTNPVGHGFTLSRAGITPF